ncbi:MAG: hypothetical protein JW744_04290 [Candidatus Diapherotrites archaeon]|uniref:Uncharacterized protein n=1 Tax=Candidatus Iainarchaeum sp. TaxID=3101447 RepID=A0A938YRM9_9ARCH|nr:hypothetical protein [Candidatus Diapherotrites archaeon]
MAKQKERWGAYIKLNGPDANRYPNSTFLDYEVRLGRAGQKLEKNEVFASSPAISKRVGEINGKWKLDGKVFTGYIYLSIRAGEKIASIGSYHPVSKKSKIPEALRNSLRGLGFASRVELRVLKDLQKRFPGYLLRHPMGSTELRKAQFKKRGTELSGKPVPIQAEIQRIADYLGEEGMRRREGEEGVKRLLAARRKIAEKRQVIGRRPRK